MNDYIVRDIFPNRKYVRLPEHDYSSAGVYFVTICTLNKQCLFGEIKNAAMRPNPYGNIVQECWNDIPKHYIEINNEIFSIMPNHVHGIIIIPDDDGRSGLKPDPTGIAGLSAAIHTFLQL